MSALGRAAGIGGAGLLLGGGIMSREINRVARLANAQIDRDDQALVRAGRLLEVGPPLDLKWRRPKGIVRCYLTGMALGGFAFWAVGMVVLIAVYHGTDLGRTAQQGEAIIGPFFWAGMVGLLGWFLGLTLLGSLLWLREVRSRVTEGLLTRVRPWWDRREQARVALDRGVVMAEAVREDLFGYRFDTDDGELQVTRCR